MKQKILLAGAMAMFAAAAMAGAQTAATPAQPNNTPDTRLGGALARGGVGGTLSGAPLGGTAVAKPPGGQLMSNTPVGGTIRAGPQGGALTGTNPVGGVTTPARRPSGSGFVIPNPYSGGISVTNPVGGQFGRAIIGGAPSTSNQVNVNATGSGVLVGGAPPVNSPPGGTLTNTGFGQLH
jgi:hypothetical protein